LPIPLLLMLLLCRFATPDATTCRFRYSWCYYADSATPHAEIDTDVAEPEQDINNTTSPNTITPQKI
jgi:hypothetical protein